MHTNILTNFRLVPILVKYISLIILYLIFLYQHLYFINPILMDLISLVLFYAVNYFWIININFRFLLQIFDICINFYLTPCKSDSNLWYIFIEYPTCFLSCHLFPKINCLNSPMYHYIILSVYLPILYFKWRKFIAYFTINVMKLCKHIDNCICIYNSYSKTLYHFCNCCT
jgi:hypothetical protein